MWVLLAIFFLLLGINKQLDMQTWFVESIKDLSIQHGWYEQRRGLQIAFVSTLGVTMFLAIVSLRLFLLSIWHRYKLIWVGMLLLFGFILIRVASFQHIDIAIDSTILGVEWNVILEMSALLIIIWGTLVKQKVASFHSVKLSEINPIVVVDKEGDVARCPQCGKQAVAPTVHQRKFKCRRCGYLYRVHVAGKPVQ